MPFLSSDPAPSEPRYSLSAIPPAPRQPSPAARRLVFSFQSAQFVLLLVGLIFLGVGLILSTVFCWSLPVDLTLAFTGKPHTGVVLSARTDFNASINGVHPLLVRYSYSTPEGTFEDEADVMGADYPELPPGEPIPLEVSSVRPQWSRVAGSTHGFFGYFGAFTLFFPLLGAALLLVALRLNLRARRAYREGRPVLAKVVGSGPDRSVRINRQHPYRIQWEFKLPDGSVHSGSISSMRWLELEPWAKASEVPVLYDPDHPDANTLYVP
jgi:hypothetical protein